MGEYHPQHNPKALPAVTTLEDLNRLPWGGNAWWDIPIMNHVDQQVKSLPRKLKGHIRAKAGFMMTGEDCGYFPGQVK